MIVVLFLASMFTNFFGFCEYFVINIAQRDSVTVL